ncbi:hypothetical protein EYF80_033341 [Liparis tanakae]|uniref:Uncharacterized protein n=1 Tax=Liparis tanakae TaxID=230148 RepID=A0A4Z2GT40_9TELE|nr:hypothetical protein EYF80_033341 [Liparis tanakae]
MSSFCRLHSYDVWIIDALRCGRSWKLAKHLLLACPFPTSLGPAQLAAEALLDGFKAPVLDLKRQHPDQRSLLLQLFMGLRLARRVQKSCSVTRHFFSCLLLGKAMLADIHHSLS